MDKRKLSTPKGLFVSATSKPINQNMSANATDELLVIDKAKWRSRNYSCGHKDARWFRINVHGSESEKIKDNKLCSYCFIEDIKQHLIRCPVCGFGILPGDPVALYDLVGIDRRMNNIKIIQGKSVLGCLRRNCCPTGGFFAGHWTRSGFKPYFPNKTTVAEHAMELF